MSDKSKRLSDAELEIMLVVWHSEVDKVSSSYVLEHLEGKRNWALPTLMTVLTRLVNKGYLKREKLGRNNLYLSIISEDTYKEREGKSVLEKLYGNSFKNFVTSRYNSRAISDDDINDLKDFLEQSKKGD